MRVVVIGKGGREHAMVKALQKSSSVEQVYAIPGNQGMKDCICFDDSVSDHEVIVKRCQEINADLVVVGPEDPLADGLSDSLRKADFNVFGPDQRGARLESSKIVAKEFMEKYSIPSAPYAKVSSLQEVQEQVSQFTAPYVLKADGLAAGKGVFICKTQEELFEKSVDIFERSTLGEAGQQAILEQFQPGYELSFFILTNGEEYTALPLAQDHKKLLDGDLGPNTGGMGTVAPMEISKSLYHQIIERVIEPTVKGFKEEAFVYRGVVFIGLMMTDLGPQVLEYNIRFGDPETQVLLPLLDGDWGEAFKTIAEGNIPELEWKSGAAACVVLAAENYPDSPVKGVSIKGDVLGSSEESYFLHAGTSFDGQEWKTNGGRVLNSIGMGSNIEQALKQAYQKASQVEWPGMQLRKDIGQNALKL